MSVCIVRLIVFAFVLLLGSNQPGDVIHEAVQKSWIDRQMRLEL